MGSFRIKWLLIQVFMIRAVKNKRRFAKITPLEYLRKLLSDTVPESDVRFMCKWSNYRDLCAHILSEKTPQIEWEGAGGCSIPLTQITQESMGIT